MPSFAELTGNQSNTGKLWIPGVSGVRVGSFGEKSTSKTHIGLTIPGFKAVFDTELNVDQVFTSSFQQEVEAGNILHFKYKVPILINKDQARYIADKLTDDFHNKVLGPMIMLKNQGKMVGQGAIIIDSSTLLWDLIRYAYVPLDDAGRTRNQMDYGGVNELYKAFFDYPLSAGFIVYSTFRVKPNFVTYTDAATGKSKWFVQGKTADWQQHTDYNLDVLLETDRMDVPIAGQPDKFNKVYVARVRKCTANPGLVGNMYMNLDWDTLMHEVMTPVPITS